MKSVILLSLLLQLSLGHVLPEEVKSYENYKVFRVEIGSEADFQTLSSLKNLHFWNEGKRGGFADVMVAPQFIHQVKENLDNFALSYSVMVENVGDLIRLEQIPAANDREVASTKHSMDWTSYHKQDDIETFLDYLAETYDFVEVESIGESYEGRPMRVIKVCRDGCGNKPAMWIDGGIHAREWITPATVTWMMRELIENDAEHPDLTQQLDWYILALVNPDGYAYTKSGDRLWRKTRSPNNMGLCKGTDANRNWGYKWNTGGSSDYGCSETYHGTEAFSEVENQNIRDFVWARKDQIKFFNTIHSYSQLILLPWGFSYENAPGYNNLLNLAEKSNEALYAVHGKSYDVGCIPCLLYIASGGSMDWALGEAGIPYSYGMELRDTGRFGFLLPADEIIPTAEETWAFHQNAARMIIAEFSP